MVTALTADAADIATTDILVDIIKGTDAAAKGLLVYRDDVATPTVAPGFTPAAVRAALNKEIANNLAFGSVDLAVAEIASGVRYSSTATGAAVGTTTVSELLIVKAKLAGNRNDPAWEIVAAQTTTALIGKFVKRDTLTPRTWKGLFHVIGG
jgi:hypothetical protein